MRFDARIPRRDFLNKLRREIKARLRRVVARSSQIRCNSRVGRQGIYPFSRLADYSRPAPLYPTIPPSPFLLPVAEASSSFHRRSYPRQSRRLVVLSLSRHPVNTRIPHTAIYTSVREEKPVLTGLDYRISGLFIATSVYGLAAGERNQRRGIRPSKCARTRQIRVHSQRKQCSLSRTQVGNAVGYVGRFRGYRSIDLIDFGRHTLVHNSPHTLIVVRIKARGRISLRAQFVPEFIAMPMVALQFKFHPSGFVTDRHRLPNSSERNLTNGISEVNDRSPVNGY